MKEYTISTSLSTLEKVFDILEEIGLFGTGVSQEQIMSLLFAHRQLRTLLNIVTSGAIGDSDLSGGEASKILSDFFFSLGENWNMQTLLGGTETIPPVKN